MRSSCCNKDEVKRGPWTPEEDELLLAYIGAHGEGNWSAVPKKAGLNRCGKSCRLRWTNYLRPDLRRGSFSQEEDELILKMQKEVGNRWSLIATKMPGRTDNDIKNHWNTQLKKQAAKLEERTQAISNTPHEELTAQEDNETLSIPTPPKPPGLSFAGKGGTPQIMDKPDSLQPQATIKSSSPPSPSQQHSPPPSHAHAQALPQIPQSHTHCYSHPHSLTHPHFRAHSPSLSNPHSHPTPHPPSHSPSHPHSYHSSHPPSHTSSHPHSHGHSHSQPHLNPNTLSYPHSNHHAHPHSHPLPHSQPQSHPHPHSDAHSHGQSHSCCQPHTPTSCPHSHYHHSSHYSPCRDPPTGSTEDKPKATPLVPLTTSTPHLADVSLTLSQPAVKPPTHPSHQKPSPPPAPPHQRSRKASPPSDTRDTWHHQRPSKRPCGYAKDIPNSPQVVPRSDGMVVLSLLDQDQPVGTLPPPNPSPPLCHLPKCLPSSPSSRLADKAMQCPVHNSSSGKEEESNRLRGTPHTCDPAGGGVCGSRGTDLCKSGSNLSEASGGVGTFLDVKPLRVRAAAQGGGPPLHATSEYLPQHLGPGGLEKGDVDWGGPVRKDLIGAAELTALSRSTSTSTSSRRAMSGLASPQDGLPSSEAPLPAPLHLTGDMGKAQSVEVSPSCFFRDSSHLRAFMAGSQSPKQYGRYGLDTLAQAEKGIAELEGAESAIVTSCGPSALSSLLMGVMKEGQHLVLSAACFRRSRRFIEKLLPILGMRYTIADCGDSEKLEEAMRRERNGGILLLDSPSAAELRSADVPRVAARCRKHGFLLCVDATYGEPGARYSHGRGVLGLGADVVLRYALKDVAGHSTAIAASVSGGAEIIERVRGVHGALGGLVDPSMASLLLSGLESLEDRMSRQRSSALSLAQALESHPRVARVFYPGLDSHPDRNVGADRVPEGSHGIHLVLELRDAELEQVLRFVDRLSGFHIALALGGTESVIELPGVMASRDGAKASLNKVVHLSIGLEGYNELYTELFNALDSSFC